MLFGYQAADAVTTPAEAIRRPGGRPFVCADEICADASSLVTTRNRELFGGEQRNDSAPRISDDDFFLNSGGGVPVDGGTISLKSKNHSRLYFHWTFKRDEARNDRALVKGKTDSVTKLKAECGHLAWETKLFSLRPNLDDCVGRYAGPDQVNGLVQPFPACLVCVMLSRSRAADVECPVVTGSIADEGMQNVEEGLVAGPNQAIREIVWVRVAALA